MPLKNFNIICRKRQELYQFMLKCMTDKQKFQLSGKLCQEVTIIYLQLSEYSMNHCLPLVLYHIPVLLQITLIIPKVS